MLHFQPETKQISLCYISLIFMLHFYGFYVTFLWFLCYISMVFMLHLYGFYVTSLWFLCYISVHPMIKIKHIDIGTLEKTFVQSFHSLKHV
jgi:hypothetical protein